MLEERKGNCPSCGKPVEWTAEIGIHFGTPYCEDCNRRHEKTVKQKEEDLSREKVTCSKCDGTGRVSGYTCMTCDGKGTVPRSYCRWDIDRMIRNGW